MWEALLAAGEPFDVMPYGTEALGVLRIEKGHVVPNELDGRTIPADFGFDRMEKDEDFIGRRSLERFREGGRKRKTFVGLVSENGDAIPRGGHLVWNPTAPRPMRMVRPRDVELLQPFARAPHCTRPDRGRGRLEGQDALRRVAPHVELRPGSDH